MRLARATWVELPSVRLHYDRGDDALVAEFLDSDPAREVRLDPRLLVELDDDGPDALPVALVVTGLRAEPEAHAVRWARELLGERAWGVVMALVEGPGSGSEEVWLDPGEVAALRAVWEPIAGPLPARQVVIGVEVRRDVVRAALVDVASLLTGSNDVIGRTTAELDHNDVDSVVGAIDAVVRELTARHPSAATDCPVGVQIGGPVRDGVVRYYYKPRPGGPPTVPWDHVPLAALLRRRLGRADVHVANDAESFAIRELMLGREVPERYAVLVVRHGVGSRLVIRGEVMDLPMEIGTFVPQPYKPLDDDPAEYRSRDSIEAISGITAILGRLEYLVGRRIPTAREAASLVGSEPEHADKILQVFREAGVGLARGLAAAQSFTSPDRWIVLGPAALVDRSTPTGAAYLEGLEEYRSYLDWPALTGATIVGSPLRQSSGALAAASVVVAARPVETRSSLAGTRSKPFRCG